MNVSLSREELKNFCMKEMRVSPYCGFPARHYGQVYSFSLSYNAGSNNIQFMLYQQDSKIVCYKKVILIIMFLVFIHVQCCISLIPWQTHGCNRWYVMGTDYILSFFSWIYLRCVKKLRILVFHFAKVNRVRRNRAFCCCCRQLVDSDNFLVTTPNQWRLLVTKQRKQ